MKGRTLIPAALLLFAGATVLAQPGPYPVIFVHGQKKEALPDSGFKTWHDDSLYSAMMEIIAEEYGGYDSAASGPLNCNVNTNLGSSGKHTIYNFSYYNLNPANPGTIGSAEGYPGSVGSREIDTQT